MNALGARRRPGDRAELMDAPDLDPCEHRRALAGLARLNAVSRTAAALWAPLRPRARAARAPLRVLDLGCGGGDVALALWRRARRAGHDLSLTLCDGSATALDETRRRAGRRAIPVRLLQRDLLAGDHDLATLVGAHDVVLSTLFLHHLEDEQAEAWLGALGRARPGLLLVDDLDRRPAGRALAWLGTRLLSRSAVVRHDGPLSVERAFTADEAAALATRAGLDGARIVRHWPARWQLRWSPGP